MKKYIKPELYFESFVLNQNIADCALEWVNSTDGSQCIANGDINQGLDIYQGVFSISNQTCTLQVTNPEDIGFCSTNASDSRNLFQS